MISFTSRRAVSIGEAMVELAPAGREKFRRGFAGDSHSDRFVAAMAADGLGTTIVSRAPDHQMGLYLIELDGAE